MRISPLILKSLVFINFTLLQQNAIAALNLKEALSELNQTPRIEKAQAAADEAKWHRVGSYSGFLPSFSASANYLVDKKYAYLDIQFPGSSSIVTFPQIIPTSSITFNGNWTFFDGFANIENWQSAKALERAADNDLNWTKFESERQAILLFYKAVAAQRLQDTAKQNIKTLEDHLNDAELFKKSGIATKYDVLRVEVQESEARTELVNAENNVALSLLQLGEALGNSNETRSVEGSLPVLNASLVQNLKYSVNKRKDLQALQERSDAYGSLAGASNRFWVPRFSLFGQYSQYNNRNDKAFDSAAYRDAYTFGVALSWNLFDGLSSIAKAKETAAQATQSEKNLEIQQIKSANSFEYWKRKYLFFCMLYHARQNDINKSTESVRLAKAGHTAGLRTNTDLLDAELELFKARAEIVNAQIGAIEALIQLELATGQSLYSFL